MSDSDASDNDRQQVDPMPKYKMRFTDMPPPLVEKAIRCKFRLRPLTFYSVCSNYANNYTKTYFRLSDKKLFSHAR